MEAIFSEKDKTLSESYVKEYLQNFLKQTAAPGLVKENDLVHQFFPGITLTELNMISASCIQDTNRF
ncbi:hypothetical protein FBD94_16520 [Pedobacter hiemivivus]|uniref:Uncharacterized protein n=1 Tax=Pedobacter hiemivivus TaxID=2530454 RepID=A0A4U1G5U8_9SPHI|nr:hypothetical protein [Pedobacter hiemivivus]TKC59137.1 hypothetical protein FBD94_16520 [Pedobacter hiemivivus]